MERFGRARAGERAFTLVELLVTMSILGLLAALAIPSLLDAQGQARDASAKSIVAEAQSDAEQLALDGDGGYAAVKKAALHRLDPALVVKKTLGEAYLSAASGTADTYTLTATESETGEKFTLRRRADGTLSRSCKIPTRQAPHGGCEHVTGVKGSW